MVTVDFVMGPSIDPGIILFGSPSVENTARMISFDKAAWKEMGEPKALRVTIDILTEED